jgi:cell division inhibitor SepF
VKAVFTKLRDFVGLNEPIDEEEYEDEMDPGYQNQVSSLEDTFPDEKTTPAPPSSEPNLRQSWRENATATGRSGMDRSQSQRGASMNNVIGMPGATNGVSEVMVLEPRSFEEMPQAIQALREQKSVVLNLTLMDPDQAQRAVDFIAGGTYALDGHQERIGESIFLFTPRSVQVSTPTGLVNEAMQQYQAQQQAQETGNRTVANPWSSQQVRMVQ